MPARNVPSGRLMTGQSAARPSQLKYACAAKTADHQLNVHYVSLTLVSRVMRPLAPASFFRSALLSDAALFALFALFATGEC